MKMKVLCLFVMSLFVVSCSEDAPQDTPQASPQVRETAGEIGRKSLPRQVSKIELVSCEAQRRINEAEGKFDQPCNTLLKHYDFLSGQRAGAEGSLNRRQITFDTRGGEVRDLDVIEVGGRAGDVSGKIHDLGAGSCSEWIDSNKGEKIEQARDAYRRLLTSLNSDQAEAKPGHCYIFFVHDTRDFFMVGMFRVESLIPNDSVILTEMEVLNFVNTNP